MLVLAREEGETIVITTDSGERIELMVVSIRGNKVRLGTTAAKSTTVHRGEIQRQVEAENRRPVPAPHFGGGTVGGMYAMG